MAGRICPQCGNNSSLGDKFEEVYALGIPWLCQWKRLECRGCSREFNAWRILGWRPNNSKKKSRESTRETKIES